MNSATFSMSASLRPLDVSAGVPRRRPDGRRALLSPGQVFLFTAMLDSSKIFSAFAPSVFIGRRSTRIKWLSVPPEEEVVHTNYYHTICVQIFKTQKCSATQEMTDILTHKPCIYRTQPLAGSCRSPILKY